MKYKVGDEVVLNDNTETMSAGDMVSISDIERYWTGQKVYVHHGDFRFRFDDDMIDHEKTAELQQDKALDHYGGMLEKIVEERNNDEYTKALMKYGRREGDNLDRVRKNRVMNVVESDKYARHKEITDYMHNTYVSKNRDYGDSFRAVHREIGKEASLGQIAHKYNRLKNIILNESTVRVEDETVIDTIIDMANYLVMLAMELEEDGD